MISLSARTCFLAILCVVAGTVIKHIRPDFSPLVRIVGSILMCGVAISLIGPIVAYIDLLLEGAALGEYGPYILKALGIAFLTQICADICRDCGEGSVASGVEIVGKMEIVLLCIPMLERILALVQEVIAW